MKKETIIAVLLGVVFGGLLAVMLIFKNKETQFDNLKAIVPTKKTTIVKKKINNTIVAFEIISPSDGAVTSSETITIKGKAPASSLIIAQSPKSEIAFRNKAENFSFEFPLAYGENIINIVSYPKDIKIRPQARELKIYYLKEEL